MNFEEFIKAMTPTVPDIKLPSLDEIRSWELEKRRIIACFGGVNTAEDGEEGFSTRVAKIEIARYNIMDKDIPVEERVPIIMLIDSRGGDLWGTWSLLKAMETSKTPIYTVNVEQASSAGGLILMAGHKRFALRGTTALVHSGSTSISGLHEQVESAQKVGNKLTKNVVEWLLSRTKITQKDYNRYAPKDWYFFDDEQVTYGIVDKMLDSFEEIFDTSSIVAEATPEKE